MCEPSLEVHKNLMQNNKFMTLGAGYVAPEWKVIVALDTDRIYYFDDFVELESFVSDLLTKQQDFKLYYLDFNDASDDGTLITENDYAEQNADKVLTALVED